MPQIKTKSFDLSALESGEPSAKRLAIVLPGRLESKDYAHIRSHVDYLGGLGYRAIAFDPPGSWDSPGDIQLYTVTNYLSSVNELMEYYGGKPTVLVGHSLGGSVAMLAAEENPRVMGFISLMSAVGRGKPEPDEEWETKGKITFYRDLPPGSGPTPQAEQKQIDLPYSYLEDAQQHNVPGAIKKCRKPKLFIAGMYDTQVTLDSVEYTFDIAAEPKQFVKIPTGHGYRYSEYAIQEINKLIGGFVESI